MGLPDGHPRVCAALTAALQRFLNQEWDIAFGQELIDKGVSVREGRNWHKPGPDDTPRCT